jgi:light-regulated signal transduction histidine kinase (bacteriophytochrome)
MEKAVLIQPFGFLLGLSRDWVVVFASSNLAAFLAIEPATVLSVSAEKFFSHRAVHDIRNVLGVLQISAGIERLYDVLLIEDRPRLDLTLYYSGDSLVIEGEWPAAERHVHEQFITRLRRLAACPSVTLLHRLAVREVQKLTGYEWVSAWRFQGNERFERLAEVAASRRLVEHEPQYTNPGPAFHARSWLKLAADMQARPVPVLEMPATDVRLDLSCGLVEAPAPSRLHALARCGISASLSIAIRVQEKFWGLIECEHPLPRRPSAPLSEALEVFALLYSLALENKIQRATTAPKLKLTPPAMVLRGHS